MQSGQMGKPRLSLGSVLPIIGIIAGLAILASPVIVDQIQQIEARRTVQEAAQVTRSLEQERYDGILIQAHAYNDQLASHERSALEVLPYDEQLDLDGTSMMAYIEIPALEITLPIYHHAEDTQLAHAAGHVEGTSLPVGGASTHSVISAHSGMPAARMFDDIHYLEPGDIFVIWTLGDPYAYEVVGSQVVEPDEVDKVGIQPGLDLVTLVTCTPYGVNSHRLLVTGQRCDYKPQQAPLIYIAPRAVPLVIGLLAVGALLAGLCIRRLVVLRRRQAAAVDIASAGFTAAAGAAGMAVGSAGQAAQHIGRDDAAVR